MTGLKRKMVLGVVALAAAAGAAAMPVHAAQADTSWKYGCSIDNPNCGD